MDLVIGKSYLVEIEDCCVDGRFTSKLIKAQAYNDDDVIQDVSRSEYGAEIQFENGVTLCMNGGVTLTEVDL